MQPNAQTPDFDRRVMRERLREQIANSSECSTAIDALRALLDQDWLFQISDNPEFASQSGIHDYDHRLQDLSPSAFERRAEHNRRLIASAEAANFEGLVTECALHLELFIGNVKAELRALELGCHLYPINSIGYGGVHNNFIEALEWLPSGAHEQLLSRFEAFPAQVESYIELLNHGIAQGRVASRSMVRNVPAQITEAIESTAVTAALDAVPQHLKARAGAALEGYKQCLDRLRLYVELEYTPCAREQDGCIGMGEVGSQVYSEALKYHTTTQLSPQEVHNIGLEEVARIETRYRTEVLEPLNFEGTFDQFVEHCKTDTAFYFDTEESLLEAYRSLCAHISSVLPAYFDKFPVSPLEIVPKNAASAPAAYYLAGTADGSRPGRFYVNISNLNERPSYEMYALALHEAIPGHHHQCSLAIENTAIPNFLRYIEDRRYEFCPARRQLYAAYLEGWALYCEALGEEMGIYPDPMSIFGRLSMEMMRAVRLVVDTGIHAHGWSVDQAIEYMMEKTGMHRHECEAECYRYEAWPGQACAYKVGEVAIWRARRKAEQMLGDQFDLKQFHNVLLDSGGVPLDSVEQMVDAWIEQVKSQLCERA